MCIPHHGESNDHHRATAPFVDPDDSGDGSNNVKNVLKDYDQPMTDFRVVVNNIPEYWRQRARRDGR